MTDTHEAAQSGRLSIDHTTIDDIRVVTVRGEIDHTVKNALSEALLPHDGAAPSRVVADLSGVTFMDSSGVNVLVTSHQAATQGQGWLRIVGPQEAVLRVLQLVGLDEVIPCHPTLQEALNG